MDLKVGVLLYHGVSLLSILLRAIQTLWLTLQAKNNVTGGRNIE